MSRTALVIGLGRVGHKVLVLLKQKLIYSDDGKMPENVRFLIIDTGVQTGEPTDHPSLASDELVSFGTNIRQLAREIANQSRPLPGQWLQSVDWLKNLPNTVFSLESGAGQVRQFGRLAIFKDVSNEAGIKQALEKNIQKLLTFTGTTQPMEIIIVATLTGGTGAGLLVDVAWLSRTIITAQFKAQVNLTGFVVFPEGFSKTIGDMPARANSFAALRELERFMNTPRDFKLERAAEPEHPHRLFDQVYLINRNPNSEGDSALALAPVLGEAIQAILTGDSSANIKFHKLY